MRLTLYDEIALKCSMIVTRSYSTSFSLGIKVLSRKYRPAIYAIYGFVRLADEIVDTFFDQQQKETLERFRTDTGGAIENMTSVNPVLHAFQWAVNTYNIDREFIDAFLYSMEMDLTVKSHDRNSYDRYIYGSAEAVGLMCLRVFCHGDPAKFDALREPARKLGSAFQKVNFLRDIRSDYVDRGRFYFPETDFTRFTAENKLIIENDIAAEFREALEGIRSLDRGSRRGVFLAYSYYMTLFRKIRNMPAEAIAMQRIRISNLRKLYLLVQALFLDLTRLI